VLTESAPLADLPPTLVRDMEPRTQASAPLRILQVVEPGIDGVFRIVEQLTDRLIAKGHHVALAYSDRRGDEPLVRFVERVKAAGGATLNLCVSNAPEPADWSAFWQLHALARRERPDVIHAHSSKAGALARGLAALGILGRYFYTPHAYYGLSGRKGLKTKLFNGIEQALGRIGDSCMSSQGELEFASNTLGLPRNRLHLMHNPIDAAAYPPPRDPVGARARFGLPPDAIVLGTIGRLSFQKDPQTLYRALAPVLAEEPRLHLLHVGRGELADELIALARELGISDRIARVDYLDQPALAYAAMDALIMTSRYEGLSLVLLEALVSDLPLILSQVQGAADIEPAKLSHCWTVPPEDVAGFSAAIRTWLRDRPAERTRNHRTQAIARFSAESWLARHEALYRGGALPA